MLRLISQKQILFFFIVACGFSWFFLLNKASILEWVEGYNTPLNPVYLGVMWGPGVAAILSFIIFRKSHNRTITLFGTSAAWSLLFYALPFILFSCSLLISPLSEKLTLWRFVTMIPLGFVMILGEESGWRGYLQDALRELPEWRRWWMIAILWEIWHFDRGWTGEYLIKDIGIKLMFFVLTFILTVIIGKATEKTKSLMAAIALHTVANIYFEIPSINTILTIALSITGWFFMLKYWPVGKVSIAKA